MEKGNDNEQNDRLSEMPDDIIAFIISSFCIRDAAKLRTLSRRWRYVCQSKLDLELDTHTVIGIKERLSYRFPESIREKRCRFVHGVDQLLKLYEGRKVDSIRICFPLGDEYASHIDRWIRTVIRAGTQKVDLDFSHYPPCDNLYDFSCQLLSIGEMFQLTHLCLNSCKLSLSPQLMGMLISLNTVDLENVPLDKSNADIIISNCLNLECLRLRGCSLPETLNIQGPFLSLKSVIVHDCCGVEKIVISSTGLTTFEYIGKEVITFSLHDVPRLEKVHIWFLFDYAKAKEYMFNGLPNDLPQLQYLSLVLVTEEPGSVRCPRPMPASMTGFNHLKQLDLFVIHSTTFNLVSLTSILNASPLLQKFYLALKKRSYEGESPEQQYSSRVHHQLKEVEVHGFCGYRNEMELAIYLLKNAVSLEQMILSPHTRMYHGGGRWTSQDCWFCKERRQEICDLLLKDRVNSHTKLIFL